MADSTGRLPTPPRITPAGALALLGVAGLGALWLVAVGGLELSARSVLVGFPDAARVLGAMFPPDVRRAPSLARALLETARIAFGGAVIGLAIGLLLSPLAARNVNPSRMLSGAVRSTIAFVRTVPELVWAVLFVAMVGLGPFAGLLTVALDTLGYCGKFFADAMEEADPEPAEALHVMGAGRLACWAGAVVPMAAPALIDHALFSVERAVRSSVVLGLVGAGGIGLELKVAMDLLLYREAAAIILGVFLMVLLVEQANRLIRRRLLGEAR